METWDQVVSAGKKGNTIADFGCGLGQELRPLRADIADTSPSPNLYALDAKRHFWDLGCELFGDSEALVAKFFCVNLARRERCAEILNSILGRVDVIITSQFLDLLWWHT